MKKYIFALIASLIIGCNGKETEILFPFGPPIETKGFAIYFLESDLLKMSDIREIDPVYAVLKKTPWICEDDIEMFDFSSQCIYLKKDKLEFLRKSGNYYYFPKSWQERPYVVTYDQEKLYVGECHNLYLSIMPRRPYIDDADFMFYPKDVILIGATYYSQYFDINFNKSDITYSDRIKSLFSKSKIFHAGINVQLKSMKIIRKDTVSLEYTFVITNEDKDNLYIMDPAKVDPLIFNRYNEPPVFCKYDMFATFAASVPRAAISMDYWEASWFSKLESGKSIERTILVKNYGDFSPGKYYCNFRYNAADKIEKSERTLSDGRYWIGPAKTKLMEVTITDRDSCIIKTIND